MSALTDAEWYLLGAILLLTLCSILTRTIYFLFGDQLPLSDGVRRALRYAPAAALVAIIVPGLFPLQADGTMTVAADQLLGALAAVAVYLRTRNTMLVIVLGMAVFWLARLLFSLLSGGIPI